MTDIKQALKEEIKTLEAQLKRAQKSLEAYTAEAGPKAKPARTSSSTTTPAPGTGASTAGSTTPGNLPDRIVAWLSRPEAVQLSTEALAEYLVAPLGQVRTTCSRLVKTGKLIVDKNNEAKTAFYSVPKAPSANPFVESN